MYHKGQVHSKSHRGLHRDNVYNLEKDFRDIKDKMLETTAAIANTAVNVKGKTEEMIEDTLSNMKDKTLNLEDIVAEYIKDNPFKAAGYSMLAGAILAVLLRKKR